MTKKIIRQLGSFVATDEAGRGHTIHVSQDFFRSRDLDGDGGETSGLKSYVNDAGRPVNRTGPGKFEDVLSGRKLCSTDPMAG